MKKLLLLKEISNNFQLLLDKESDLKYIHSLNTGLSIQIKENGYIPKTGLSLMDYLFETDFYGINAVDIGTGETGVIAQNLFKQNKFQKIWAVDIDENAIKHACGSSDISKHINWVHNHCFNGLAKLRFDLIVSNPPQMPVFKNFSLHDDGGKDGLDIIKIILSEGVNYLTENGKIVLLCFDFLVDCGAIDEFANSSGLNLGIKKTIYREIRLNGKTMENLDWICKMYPKFKVYYTKDGIPFHYIKIIELRKNRNPILINN